MNTDIGTTFESLTREELMELAPVLNEMGDRYLFTYEDGHSEIKENEPYVETREDEIWRLKRYLSDTDYCAIKCSELGESMSTLYPEIQVKRAEARARINELEEES